MEDLVCDPQRCEGVRGRRGNGERWGRGNEERWGRGNGGREREETGDETCWSHSGEPLQGLSDVQLVDEATWDKDILSIPL